MGSISIRVERIAQSLVKAGEHKRQVARWWAKTSRDCAQEMESKVRQDRLALTDADFRVKYANHIGTRS